MTTDNLNLQMRESLEEIDLYENKTVDELVNEALEEDKQEEKENYSFEAILNKYDIN